MIGEVVEENGVKSIRTLSGALSGGLPLGTIIAIHTSVVPSGFLPCNGAAYDINQYPSLYTMLGQNTLPDLRECNLVGIGESTRAIISAHDIYSLGQFKDDQIQTLNATLDTSGVEVEITDPGHTHTAVTSVHNHTLHAGTYFDGGNGVFTGADDTDTITTTSEATTVTVNSATTGITASIADGSITANLNGYRNGAVTHGKNYGVNYIIKATTGSIDVDDAEIYAQVVAFITSNYVQVNKEDLADKDLVYYDATTDKFESIPVSAVNGRVLSWNGTSFEWVANGNVSTHIFDTEAAYTAALAITEGNAGYIRNGDIVIKNYVTDVLRGVDNE